MYQVPLKANAAYHFIFESLMCEALYRGHNVIWPVTSWPCFPTGSPEVHISTWFWVPSQGANSGS